jgi:hypothetical protein
MLDGTHNIQPNANEVSRSIYNLFVHMCGNLLKTSYIYMGILYLNKSIQLLMSGMISYMVGWGIFNGGGGLYAWSPCMMFSKSELNVNENDIEKDCWKCGKTVKNLKCSKMFSSVMLS